MPDEPVSVYGEFNIITLNVKFFNWDYMLLSSQSIAYGSDAVAPNVPERLGYTFVGWYGSYTNVTDDITIIALYILSPFSVTFVGYDDIVLDVQTVGYGLSAAAPKVPAVNGFSFIGGDFEFDCVTSDIVVHAMYVSIQQTLRGDANGDGAVDFSDVATIYNAILSASPLTFFANADVDGDGNVTFFDVVSLYGMIAG